MTETICTSNNCSRRSDCYLYRAIPKEVQWYQDFMKASTSEECPFYEGIEHYSATSIRDAEKQDEFVKDLRGEG